MRGLTVLLVEDAADTRDVLERLLEADGAEVLATGSARHAVELAAVHEIDVLLTDLGLPDIPGEALIRRVLADAPRRPRVVAITGYGEPFASRARVAGADVVLTKPIGWNELVPHLTASEPDAVVAQATASPSRPL
ncbi:MAG: response regulator [Candidatus Rokubacteria bacterium]|nr:response regulator [Candidatus Rokubacteria bacterium]